MRQEAFAARKCLRILDGLATRIIEPTNVACLFSVLRRRMARAVQIAQKVTGFLSKMSEKASSSDNVRILSER